MGKVAGKIVLFLVPVFLVLGSIRFFFKGFDISQGFVPAYSTWLAWFSDFPNIAVDVQQYLADYNQATDLIPDWLVILTYMNPLTGGAILYIKFNALLNLIWSVIGAPFKVIGWFFLHWFA